MSEATLATAVTTALSLFLLAVLVLHLYRDYRVDLFRHRMFALRDSLFDYAAEGGISFDHPAYGMVRSLLNGFIRFGDRITLGSMFVGWRAHRRDSTLGKTFDRELNGQMSSLNPEQKAKLNDVVLQASIFVTEQLVMTSPLLLMLLVPAALVGLLAVLQAAGSAAVRKTFAVGSPIRRLLEPLDQLALEYGTPQSA